MALGKAGDTIAHDVMLNQGPGTVADHSRQPIKFRFLTTIAWHQRSGQEARGDIDCS